MKFLTITFLFAAGLSSCAHQPKVSTPAQTEKTQDYDFVDKGLINANTEKALGESIFSNLAQKHQWIVLSDEFKSYTSEIAKNLTKNSNRPEIEYEVYISPSKEFFAYGLPGGKILISKSVFDAIKTESEYANVIANQIAHVAKQHLIKNLMTDSEYAKALNAGTLNDRLVQQSIFSLTELGFEIEKINEADRLAPVYAMHLGYDTNGLLNVLNALQTSMQKKHIYGKTDLNSNAITHRASMNGVFVRALEKMDKSSFPKTEDRFPAMLKKIKPISAKKK